MKFGLLDKSDVLEMIESRAWWIFVGTHSAIDEIDKKFYHKAEGTFMTIWGPPVGPFAKAFPDCRILVLNFAKKEYMTKEQLMDFVNNHPDRVGLPPMVANDKQDIVFLTDEEELREE